MRYQTGVSDFVHQDALKHLSTAEAGIAAVLRRPWLIALACVMVFTGAGWLALGMLLATGSDAWDAICRVAASGDWRAAGLVLWMWSAMTAAMMLPTAGPMILTYTEIADTAARKGQTVVSPFVLTAGYVAVWLGFAFVAAVLQVLLTRFSLVKAGEPTTLLAATLFAIAGAYQFTALKNVCLHKCQRPFPFFSANWTTERDGVFRLGLQQGLLCLACCWAMMLLMFALGTMNILWMAVLGALMTIEKMSTTSRFSRAIGGLFIAAGVALAIFALVTE